MPLQITPLPSAPSRADPATFATKADAWVAGIGTWTTETNAVAVEVNNNTNSAASSASTATTKANEAAASALASANSANAVKWVSGTTYSIGTVVFSPITFLTYRRKTAGAGTTDPSADSTNWQLITSQGGMTLLATITPVNGAATASATGLAPSKSIIVITESLTFSTSNSLLAAISSNNGSTYSSQSILLTNSSTTPSGYIEIFRTDASSSNKAFIAVQAGGGGSAGAVTDVTGVINAIRISASTTFTGNGRIFIYGIN